MLKEFREGFWIDPKATRRAFPECSRRQQIGTVRKMKAYSIMCDEQHRYEIELERTYLVWNYKTREEAALAIIELMQENKEIDDNWYRHFYVVGRELVE